MPKINYITNLDVEEFSGGWSGMNHHLYNQLKKRYEINLIANVEPPYSLVDRISSKGLRALGLGGKFPAFSKKRLSRIKGIVEEKLDQTADMNFYHGSTPWLLVDNALPYSVYLDACFATYINVYHNSFAFSRAQLKRLFNQEASFLQKASAVFFSSEWALENTKQYYDLAGGNFHVAGLGGALSHTQAAKLAGSNYFLFVGLDFHRKGGVNVIEAFKKVHTLFPDIQLKIVGDRPDDKYLSLKNVEYIGMINKKTDEAKLTEIFSDALCFLLPTSKDMTPLVLIEAGSVGLPVIATNVFGIPEIVKNGVTGILVENNSDLTDNLAEAMVHVVHHPEKAAKMGKNAVEHIQTNFTWDNTGRIIYGTLNSLESQ